MTEADQPAEAAEPTAEPVAEAAAQPGAAVEPSPATAVAPATEPPAAAEPVFDRAETRPLAVGVGSGLMIVAGIAEIAWATLFYLLFGGDATVFALIVGLAGVVALAGGIGLRLGRSRNLVVIASAVTTIAPPLTIGLSLFGALVMLCGLIALAAAIVDGAWFRR